MTRIHLMGIGGVGVSAIARVYMARGDEVSGCDSRASEVTRGLEEDGAVVLAGHDPEHVLSCDRLVFGRATPLAGASEIGAARAMGVEVLTHAEALAGLLAETDSLGVAGSAGKTTVTHMLGSILTAAGWDPTVLVGDGANVRVGRSDWLVAELDESDRSLTVHRPKHAIVTNVDFDHPDHFRDLDDVAGVFQEFLGAMPPGGTAVVCADDARAAALTTPARRVTYGFGAAADYRCGEGRPFELWRRGDPLGTVALPVPGRHNVLNATGAIALAMELGVPIEAVRQGLGSFQGAHRRMERLGFWRGAAIYDDYAHHPAKVEAALAAARELPYRRVIAVFQPHRYTRLAALMDAFAGSFELADQVLVTEIYAAGEENPGRLSGADLALRMRHARFTPDFAAVREALEDLAGNGDMVLLMGAGDIWRLGRELADRRD